MRYLLDTTVLIDALRGRRAAERVRNLRRAQDVPYICVVNIEEVVRGVRAGEEPATLGFLRAFRMAPVGREQGELAGRWRRDFAARGITLSQADCLVAAAAVAVDARLATGNPKDFPMDAERVDHWPVGE